VLLLPEAWYKKKATYQGCISDGFEPNAYKLMKMSDYDFSKPPLLGNVVEAKSYGLNNMQKWYRDRVAESWHQRLTLAMYHPNWWKFQDDIEEVAYTIHRAEEANDDKGDNVTSNWKPLVFDRLQQSTSQQRPSLFNRMGKGKAPKPSVFERLKGDK